MYDTGIENLKKAALSVKVRSFLTNSDIDADMENPELALDLQSLIDDPNFEVSEGLFPELLHDKISSSSVNGHGQILRGGGGGGHHSNGIHHGYRNPLAYLPQPVHGGSTGGFGGPGNNGSSASSSPSSSPNGLGAGDDVKAEPMDHHSRLDYNANTVSSSSDPGYSSGYSSSSNNLTSPSSTSSSSSGGGGASYSPTYGGIHPMGGGVHHNPQHADQGGVTLGKNGVLQFTPNGSSSHPQKLLPHNHPHHHHPHSNGNLSKKMKNVDKASDEYKRRRERNNVAVRKSREKAKLRSRETEERVKLLSKENERLQKKIDLLTEELTFLRSFFSNVGGLPEQIHREFNKHLESFQHHHIQNGIQFPSFASFKSMQ